jgi:SAM-dependent methyltransferase
MMSMIFKFIRDQVARDRHASCTRCHDWGVTRVAQLKPKALLDVGCGDGFYLKSHLGYTPALYCGIEAAPALRRKAEANGLQVAAVDLNGPWPYAGNTFDVLHSSQVIEYLHNTRLFVQEMHRVLKPGGTAIVGSENLTSFLNLGALALGYTPFSLMRVCGWYLGNPLGLHAGETDEEGVPITDPAFAGVTGHIRVLSVVQAKELFEKVGFQTEARSMGLMPVPDALGRHLEQWMPRRGHFLVIEATKPTTAK